jgi:Arc/MetJ-type ribon-helix-helix transcriptional regulator
MYIVPRPAIMPSRVDPVTRLTAIYKANQDEAQADDMRLFRRYQDRAEFSRAAIRLLEAEEAARNGSRNQGQE